MSDGNFKELKKALSEYFKEQYPVNKKVRAKLLRVKIQEILRTLKNFQKDLTRASDEFTKAYNLSKSSPQNIMEIRRGYLKSYALINSVGKTAYGIFEKNPISSACLMADGNIERTFLKPLEPKEKSKKVLEYEAEKEALGEKWEQTKDHDEQHIISKRIELLSKYIDEEMAIPIVGPEGLEFILESIPRCANIAQEFIILFDAAEKAINENTSSSEMIRILQPIWSVLNQGQLHSN